jgi:hypothetical protein
MLDDLLLNNDSQLSFFCSVYAQRLIYSLNNQWNVPTIMQNLGYTAQCSVPTFETQVEEITSYLSQKISQVIEFHHQQSTHWIYFAKNNVDVQYKFFSYLYCSWNKLHVWSDGVIGWWWSDILVWYLSVQQILSIEG